MAAPTDSSGSMLYWYNGKPFKGLLSTANSNNPGSAVYWYNGKPSGFVLPLNSTSTGFIMYYTDTYDLFNYFGS